MGFAPAERADFCESAVVVGSGAPTLCEGWTAADLVAHVWTRENDPVAAAGIVVPALGRLTEEHNRRALQRWGFTGLVELVRQGPPRGTFYALPGVDESANAVEFFVHTEDLRRPNGLPRRPRTDAFEDMAWRRLSAMARLSFRAAATGVVLEREPTGATVRAKPGASTVVVLGRPSELLLFAFGRTRDADVRLVGTDRAVAALVGTHTGP